MQTIFYILDKDINFRMEIEEAERDGCILKTEIVVDGIDPGNYQHGKTNIL